VSVIVPSSDDLPHSFPSSDPDDRFDVAALARESTVRGRFIQDVQAAASLSDVDKDLMLLVGLLALEGAEDLEVS
jgi:hypothetical protein